MLTITRLIINGVPYDLAVETVPDASITPDKIADDMNFTEGGRGKKNFLFPANRIRLMTDDGTTTVGYLLRHKGEKIGTNDLAGKSVTVEKLSDALSADIQKGVNAVTTAVQANMTATLARESAGEALNKAHAVESQAAAAQETADEANTLAGSAFTDAQEAKQKANTAMSIAKGANQAEVFENVAQMNKWIGERKDEVEADSVTGKTLPAGTTIIYSVADNPDGALLDSASLTYGLTINGIDLVYRDSDVFYKQGRCYFAYVLGEDTYVESIGAWIEYYNGNDFVGCTDNPRWAYVEGSVDTDNIDFDLIKSHNITVGQNFYIRELNVPDYWWDGSKPQQLETGKVKLDEYADKNFVAKNYVPNATSQGLYAYDWLYEDAYGQPVFGNKTINYTPDAHTQRGWEIVQRDGDGFINAKNPEGYNHVANKGYVDKFASVAKGANQAEVFDNVERMNIWIRTRKAEVKADSVTGMTLPAGTTIIYSADPVAYAGEYGGALQINDTYYSDNLMMIEKHGRFFALVVLDTDTTIESVKSWISMYGEEVFEVGENPRWSWTSETITSDKIWNEGIDYDLIKSHNITVGQNLYIRDVGVPDYWWDGSKPQQLETQKVNLTDYEARIAALEAKLAQ